MRRASARRGAARLVSTRRGAEPLLRPPDGPFLGRGGGGRGGGGRGGGVLGGGGGGVRDPVFFVVGGEERVVVVVVVVVVGAPAALGGVADAREVHLRLPRRLADDRADVFARASEALRADRGLGERERRLREARVVRVALDHVHERAPAELPREKRAEARPLQRLPDARDRTRRERDRRRARRVRTLRRGRRRARRGCGWFLSPRRVRRGLPLGAPLPASGRVREKALPSRLRGRSRPGGTRRRARVSAGESERFGEPRRLFDERTHRRVLRRLRDARRRRPT